MGSPGYSGATRGRELCDVPFGYQFSSAVMSLIFPLTVSIQPYSYHAVNNTSVNTTEWTELHLF